MKKRQEVVSNGRHLQQRDNQTAGHLSHSMVQVVHDHQHDGGCLTGLARILINGVGSEVAEVNPDDDQGNRIIIMAVFIFYFLLP